MFSHVQTTPEGAFLRKIPAVELIEWDANNYCTAIALEKDGKAEQFNVHPYFTTSKPQCDPITQSVIELDPVLSFNGTWEQAWEVSVLNADIRAANIAAKKSQLTQSATDKRWAVMTGGLTLPNGVSVGTTVDDQNRITSVVANASLVGLTDASEVDFKSQSGWVKVTIAQIKMMAGAIGQHVQACYTAERAHHEAIAVLETAEDVAEYDVNAGWPL